MAAETKIDEESAAQMLRAGERVRVVADHFGVSTQAIYLAIRQGRLPARANVMPQDATCAAAASDGSGSN